MQRYSRKALYVVTILSCLGMVVTAYLIYQHYKDAGGAFCNVNDYVNCDIVNKSVYSEIYGVPVAILGFIAYLILFVGSLDLIREWRLQKIAPFLRPSVLLTVLTVFAGLSVLFSLYLTYIEFFVLEALCPLCLTQQVLIFIIFIILTTLCIEKEKS